MPREELLKLIAAVRASIAQLSGARTTDERTVTRALAHLCSACDELELLLRERVDRSTCARLAFGSQSSSA